MKHRNLPELESVNRITNIPIVETGWNYAGFLYNRIKKSNNLFLWTLDQAESSLNAVLNTASPAAFLFERPITTIDKIICKSLDVFEQRVPSINLPPQMIIFNTKKYVSDVGKQIARPVLKRADSVKQMGNNVLASKYTAFAADKLDDALTVADKYVDKYLPADATDSTPEEKSETMGGPAGKAINTSQHVYRFSKKLRRRLTQRTLAEAKALKAHSAEAIHVLVYVAELIATDPKMAMQKGIELWHELSKNEPENQARPENLEQLIVMLTRESARRFVHIVNFTSAGVYKVPQMASRTLYNLTNNTISILNNLMKTVHLEGAQDVITDFAKLRMQRIFTHLKQLNAQCKAFLEHLSKLLASQGQDVISNKCDTPSPPPASMPPPSPVLTTVTNKISTTNSNTHQQQIRASASNASRSTNRSISRDSLQPPVNMQEQSLKANRHVSNNAATVNNGVSETSLPPNSTMPTPVAAAGQ